MIKIGLVGEDPNDTSSIKNLFQKKYGSKVCFYPLAKRIKGYQLDNPKIKRSLQIEFNDKKCNFILYIRDLDGFKTEKSKIIKCLNWFKELDATINKNGILLLNIWELEGLILADIGTFNSLYNISCKFNGDPMVQKEPKEILMKLTRNSKKKYRESHCPEIFEKLNFDTLEKRCTYFRDFIIEFNKKI